GSALSGSLELDNTSPQYVIMSISRCLSGPEIQGGKKLFAGAKVRLREGQTAGAAAQLRLHAHPDGNCSKNTLGDELFQATSSEVPRGTWIPLTIGSQKAPIVLPEGTNSVNLVVSLVRKGDPPLTMNIDDVFLATGGTPLCDGMPATIVGTPAGDLIHGTSGSDVIVGRGGGDVIRGGAGNDRICGGPGNDVLLGGPGDDRLFGQGGDDSLYGGARHDFLNGGRGNDTLRGNAGKDRLNGGSGTDHCHGGPGADVAKKCNISVAVP